MAGSTRVLGIATGGVLALCAGIGLGIAAIGVGASNIPVATFTPGPSTPPPALPKTPQTTASYTTGGSVTTGGKTGTQKNALKSSLEVFADQRVKQTQALLDKTPLVLALSGPGIKPGSQMIFHLKMLDGHTTVVKPGGQTSGTVVNGTAVVARDVGREGEIKTRIQLISDFDFVRQKKNHPVSEQIAVSLLCEYADGKWKLRRNKVEEILRTLELIYDGSDVTGGELEAKMAEAAKSLENLMKSVDNNP